MPGLVVWPLLGLFAALLTIPLMPILWFFEWLLIEKSGFYYGLESRFKNSLDGKLIIGIPRVEDGLKNPDPVLSSINRMPITVFLGLFAFLIVSYLLELIRTSADCFWRSVHYSCSIYFSHKGWYIEYDGICRYRE